MANDVPQKLTKAEVDAILANSYQQTTTLDDVADTNIQNTRSFLYDVPGTGLKSTQQVNVDWSKFENHTFFNSAEVNVNVAFDKIINKFPFDGTKQETQDFFEQLSGFEKYVLDLFPKNVGSLIFSGTQVGENNNNGTKIIVKDYAGSLYPELSKIKTGQQILDPTSKSWTLEFHILVPDQSNDKQVIIQRLLDQSTGFVVYLEQSSTSTVDGKFLVMTGGKKLSVTFTLTKGQFSHVCLQHDKSTSLHSLNAYVDLIFSTSNKKMSLSDIITTNTTLVIGSGSSFYDVDNILFTPQQSFSGQLDEFRFFHELRSYQQLEQFAKKSIYASDTLKLYLKFNEPTGLLGASQGESINQIVLDSSGNSLHSLIDSAGFWTNLRSTNSPITYERVDLSPILFTSNVDVAALNNSLLAEAVEYDKANPNIITKLVPQHYLVEGQLADGLDTQEGTIGSQYKSNSIPGSGQLGSTQIMLSFLYIWAKFFDELKIFVDAFGKLYRIDYETNDTIPDNFLGMIYKFLGFNTPPMFIDSSIEQYIEAENVGFDISRGAEPLRSIQNQILRRILVSLRTIIRSKGTLRSVKSFLRSMGIDPNETFRIIEYGGPTTRGLSYSRTDHTGNLLWAQFFNGQNSALSTAYLNSTRVEPGFPEQTFTSSDGLLTSGSWTYEALYRFQPNRTLTSVNQSLARICTTGSNSSLGGIQYNLVANTSAVTLYGRPSALPGLSDAPILQMSIPEDIFDGDDWNVSFGRTRNDAIPAASSSYFLRIAKIGSDESVKYSTSSYYNELGESSDNTKNSLGVLSSLWNASGSYITIGNQTVQDGAASSYTFLNNSLYVTDSVMRQTNFEGDVSHIRFWSKALSQQEWNEHIRNFESFGVDDPRVNYSFNTTSSGSFERLRLDISMNQDVMSADVDGNIKFFDYSQNNYHASGSSFLPSTNIFKNEVVKYNTISPYFDEAATIDKVRVRGYTEQSNIDAVPWAETAPVYEINPSDNPFDDNKFSIEFSLVDALNKDIIKIFSTLDSLDNILGDPNLMFSSDYPGLENLRDIYFNRLTGKMNFKSFFEYFRWFESSIGLFLEQLIPRKSHFYGTNFVIESHMLERPKHEHLNNSIYLYEETRYSELTTLLLQQIAGSFRRY